MNRDEVTKEDWQSVLRTMKQHNREDGYVDTIDGDFIFFDEDPMIGGVSACHVTKSDVEKYIKEYDE